MGRRRRRVGEDRALEGEVGGSEGDGARGDRNAHACDTNATRMRHRTDKSKTLNDTNTTQQRQELGTQLH